MSPKLQISESLIERLKKTDIIEDRKGCLFGVMYNSTLLALGLSLESFDGDNECTADIQLNYPTEVDYCGIFKNAEGIYNDNELKENLQDVDMTDNPLVILVNEKREVLPHFLIHNKFEKTKFEVISNDELWKKFTHIRLQTTLPLLCEATATGVKNALQSQRKRISSGQISFHIDKTSYYLFDIASKVVLTGATDEPSLGDLINVLYADPNGKKKHVASVDDIIPIKILMKTTRDLHSEKQRTTAVKMVTTQGKPSYSISMPVIIDALAMTNRDRKLIDLYSVLVETACRSLKLLEHNLLQQLDQVGIGDGVGLKLPEPYHFLPKELNHFFTMVIPKDVPDENLVKVRMHIHEKLNLSIEKPLFRRGNAYPLDKPPQLLNPHESMQSLVTPPKEGVIVALVKGRYAYHHYMQDRFDDNGWGCAYRSLQTLCSWLRHQGYTTRPIPSHKDIQECLVSIGDKPASFVGSKQWIGSTEVSFVLESLYGTQSRILFINSGSEMNQYAPELIHHFQKHGSPIMIGGGVLAHTILGIEYNTLTQEARYLILDPHYTGTEDINVILNKGWCGWKNDTFWNKSAHYNLCLPQTKIGI